MGSAQPDSEEKESRSETSRWTRRFVVPEVEEAFVNHMYPQVWTNLSKLCGVVFAVLSLFTADRTYRMAMGRDYSSRVAADGVEFLAAQFVLVLGSLVLGLLTWFATEFTRRLGIHVGEAVALMYLCSLLIYSFTVTGFAHVLVDDPDDVHDQQLKSLYRVVWLGLVICAELTCSHLLLCIRWYMHVVVDIVCVVLFVVYGHSVPGQVDYTTILVVVGMIYGTSEGLRFREKSARMLFATMVDERTLRVQAEFRRMDFVARAAEDAQGSSYGGTLSVGLESVASTTASAKLFLRLERHVESLSREGVKDLINLGIHEQWLIEEEELEIFPETRLGRGGQATILRGRFCFSEVAVKRYEGKLLKACGKLDLSVLNELRIMRRVRHPNIALFYGAHITVGSTENLAEVEHLASASGRLTDAALPLRISLVLERVPGLNLYVFLSDLQGADQHTTSEALTARSITMKQVGQALIYLHSRTPCVVHADVKPDNVLVEMRGATPFAKLLDFGLSRTVTRNSKVTGGTKNFVAPEIKSGESCRAHPSADVFSFGRMLSLMAKGARLRMKLWADESSADGTPRYKAIYWAPSSVLSSSWSLMINTCTAHNSNQRPSMREVYEELWPDSGASFEDFWWESSSGDPADILGHHPGPAGLVTPGRREESPRRREQSPRPAAPGGPESPVITSHRL